MCLIRARGWGRRGGTPASVPAPAVCEAVAGARLALALIDQRRPQPEEQPGLWETLGVGTFSAPGPWQARASASSGGFCWSVDRRWRLREVPWTKVPQLSLCPPGITEAVCLEVVEGATSLCPLQPRALALSLAAPGGEMGVCIFSLSPPAPKTPRTPGGRETWSGVSRHCFAPSELSGLQQVPWPPRA